AEVAGGVASGGDDGDAAVVAGEVVGGCELMDFACDCMTWCYRWRDDDNMAIGD
nr:hypothetical protein [Tanacetum cinerariifolium]